MTSCSKTNTDSLPAVTEPHQRVVAFVGRQNSGKTTLVEKLIACLVERGWDVGSVKHHGHPGFSIDVEGKDSWRHKEAGSREVAIVAPDKFALIRSLDEEMSLQQVIAAMSTHDVIIVEGFRLGEMPTIELFRAANPNDDGRTIAQAPQQVIAAVSDKAEIEQEAAQLGLPCFGFEDIAALAAFVESTIIRA